LVHLCNNVSLKAQQKFHFQKPAVVEILIITIGVNFYWGTL